MNAQQHEAMIGMLIYNARLARDQAETIHHLDPAHKHWHDASDAMHDAIDALERMLPYRSSIKSGAQA